MLTAHGVFCLSCLFWRVQTNNQKFYSSVHQQRQFVSVKAGDNITLQCFYQDIVDARFYWYRQNLGRKPQLISTVYKYEGNGTFHDEFMNNPRFMLVNEKGQNHLKITNLNISDSATYYCASSYLYRLEFAEGTIVSVEGSASTIQTLVHQSGSGTVQSGASVSLNCSVQTGTCDGEHRVYWFKDSEGSDPSLIYTHEEEKNQCERKPNTQTHTCVFKLPLKNLNVSHVGTYYCAVVSCGHILFGDGTSLDLSQSEAVPDVWTGAFIFTSILSVLLAFSLCVITKTNCSKSSESEGFFQLPPADVKGYLRAETMCYAVLMVMSNRSKRQKNPIWTECVYYKIKDSN